MLNAEAPPIVLEITNPVLDWSGLSIAAHVVDTVMGLGNESVVVTRKDVFSPIPMGSLTALIPE